MISATSGDLCTFFDQFFDKRLSNAICAAGDNYNFIFKIRMDILLLVVTNVL